MKRIAPCDSLFAVGATIAAAPDPAKYEPNFTRATASRGALAGGRAEDDSVAARLKTSRKSRSRAALPTRALSPGSSNGTSERRPEPFRAARFRPLMADSVQTLSDGDNPPALIPRMVGAVRVTPPPLTILPYLDQTHTAGASAPLSARVLPRLSSAGASNSSGEAFVQSGGNATSVGGSLISAGVSAISAGGNAISAGGSALAAGASLISAGASLISAGGNRAPVGGSATSAGWDATSAAGDAAPAARQATSAPGFGHFSA